MNVTVGMFNLTSPSVAQLLMEGNWTIGESDLVAFIAIDAMQGNSWSLKCYMFETEVNLMKLLLAMKVYFPFFDYTHYSIYVSKVYGQYTAGDFIVLTFEGIIRAGDWFVDEGCYILPLQSTGLGHIVWKCSNSLRMRTCMEDLCLRISQRLSCHFEVSPVYRVKLHS